jgi:hypothetical protein
MIKNRKKNERRKRGKKKGGREGNLISPFGGGKKVLKFLI